MDLRHFVRVNAIARIIFEGLGGIPRSVAVPDWDSVGDDEMACCKRGVFEKYGQAIIDIPLEVVVQWFDCIGFMTVTEASEWLPIWMCASVYALDVLEDPTENVIQWTQFKLEDSLRVGRVPTSLPAVRAFAQHVYGDDEDADIWQLLEQLERRLEADSN
jgi:hypothetical protein